MPRKEFVNSRYTSMYLIVFFDLPVKTKNDRREYARFRKTLLNAGFQQLQYSVYSRYCHDARRTQHYRDIVHKALPPRGAVRLLDATTRQFETMENFIGREQAPYEAELDLFIIL